MSKLRVFLADDHTVLRDGLTMLINAQPDMEVVGQAADGHELVRQLRDCQADVIVLDVSMAGGGAQATAQLRTACPDMAIIALTRHSESGYVRQLLQAGVHGYVCKQTAATELLHAIHAVATGNRYLDSNLTERAMQTFMHGPADSPAAREAELSERENDVMHLMAYGYSNKEIATQLGLSIKTIETYKARAMEKLGIYSRVALVRYALQHGWLEQS